MVKKITKAVNHLDTKSGGDKGKVAKETKKLVRGNYADYKETNTSFAGSDMVCSIRISLPADTGEMETHTIIIGEMQTITYSIHMDKFPIRSLGNVNAKDFTFGPRTIAGSLVFSVFDKHFYQRILESARKAGGYIEGKHPLMDELPPFDVTISFNNEYGAHAHLVIYGITIVDEGQVMSMNDIYTENTYQYMANDIEYMTDQDVVYRDEQSSYNFVAAVNGSSKGSSYKPVASTDESEDEKADKPPKEDEEGKEDEDEEEVETTTEENAVTVNVVDYAGHQREEV